MRITIGAALLATGLAGAAPVSAGAPARWWMDEPVRLVQTNVRGKDSALDARRLVEQVAEFPANTLLFNMGGIVAQYPTRVPFHYPSPHLPPGRDLFGDVLREAHARKIRVVGRFDLSKTQKAVFDAHPEWFFRRASGEPAVYNGLYSACINGGYYREHALRILAEALERYAVDGLFFNMFGIPAGDCGVRADGPCHCDACKARFQAHHHRPLPTSAKIAQFCHHIELVQSVGGKQQTFKLADINISLRAAFHQFASTCRFVVVKNSLPWLKRRSTCSPGRCPFRC